MWKRIIGLSLLLITVAFVLGLLVKPSKVSEANLARVEMGMTLSEVEAILGKYQGGTPRGGLVVEPDGSTILFCSPPNSPTLYQWQDDLNLYVQVGFDETGRVFWKRVAQYPPTEPTLRDRVEVNMYRRLEDCGLYQRPRADFGSKRRIADQNE